MKWQIREFAELTGVSVRTLHYYDAIGLLKPSEIHPQNGYRFYDDRSLQRMQEILFYRELDFPLKQILAILSSPSYDKTKALTEQKHLLMLKKERLERLLGALDEALKGEIVMDAFDSKDYDQYREEVSRRWGQTEAYAAFTEKTNGSPSSDIYEGLDDMMGKFADCMRRGCRPEEPPAQSLVRELQTYISDTCYPCTDEIVAGLGQMYVSDERFRTNIDRHGEGTAAFICAAIQAAVGA